MGDEWRGYFLHLGREEGVGGSGSDSAGMKMDGWWEERRDGAGSLLLLPHLLLVFHLQLVRFGGVHPLIASPSFHFSPHSPPPPLFIFPSLHSDGERVVTVRLHESNPLIDSFSRVLMCDQRFGYRGNIMIRWVTGSFLYLHLLPGPRFLNVIWALSEAGRKDGSQRGVLWWRTKVVGWDARWAAEQSGFRGLLRSRRFDYRYRPGNGDGCGQNVGSAPLDNGINGSGRQTVRVTGHRGDQRRHDDISTAGENLIY